MPAPAYNLAIETSGRAGSVTLGRGDELLENRGLPPQQRHTADLMPTIDALCRDHGVTPHDLAELYLSIGPGSFTGLRIGVATAKTLAHVLGIKLVAIPTLDVLAQNGPVSPNRDVNLAVCLNLKGQTMYTAIYRRAHNEWLRTAEPALRTMAELLRAAPRPLMILGDPLPPEEADVTEHPGVTILPPQLAVARSEAVWNLARAAAKRGEFIDPIQLAPLYVRPVEAEELWKLRHPTP